MNRPSIDALAPGDDPGVPDGPASADDRSAAIAAQRLLQHGSNIPDASARVPGHVLALDGIRGVAILAVLVSHLIEAIPDSGGRIDHAVRFAAKQGRHGVDLFFVLSGFLITGILLDTRRSPDYFRSFFGRRALRILPLAYVYIALVQLVIGPLTSRYLGFDMSSPRFFHYLTYTSNLFPNWGHDDNLYSHLWSLVVEEQFYFAWPIVIFLLPRRARLGWFCTAGIVMAFAIRTWLTLDEASPNQLQRWTPCRIDDFLMGGLGALAARSMRWRGAFGRLAIPLGVIAVVALAILTVASAGRPWERYVGGTVRWSLIGVASACLVFWAGIAGSANRILTSPALTVPGRYCYGIYILHVAAVQLMPPAPPSWGMAGVILRIALMLLATAILAWASMRWLEAPMLRLKRYFPYRPAATAPIVGG